MNNFDMYRLVDLHGPNSQRRESLPAADEGRTCRQSQTAKSLGLELPTSVLLSADEVIE